jgi:hypothetical protein
MKTQTKATREIRIGWILSTVLKVIFWGIIPVTSYLLLNM